MNNYTVLLQTKMCRYRKFGIGMLYLIQLLMRLRPTGKRMRLSETAEAMLSNNTFTTFQYCIVLRAVLRDKWLITKIIPTLNCIRRVERIINKFDRQANAISLCEAFANRWRNTMSYYRRSLSFVSAPITSTDRASMRNITFQFYDIRDNFRVSCHYCSWDKCMG